MMLQGHWVDADFMRFSASLRAWWHAQRFWTAHGHPLRQGHWRAYLKAKFQRLGFRFEGEVAVRMEDGIRFTFDEVGDEAARQQVEHALREVWRRQCFLCFLRS